MGDTLLYAEPIITSNFEPMKTQIVPGPFDTAVFPVFSAKAGKTGVNGNSINSAPVSKSQLEPVAAKCNSARRPVRRGNFGLPASLQDWLACNAAVEIRQRGRNGTEDTGYARRDMAAESAAA